MFWHDFKAHLQLEVLIGKLCSVDGLAASTIVVGEITALAPNKV
jgi:hypothetical protein